MLSHCVVFEIEIQPLLMLLLVASVHSHCHWLMSLFAVQKLKKIFTSKKKKGVAFPQHNIRGLCESMTSQQFEKFIDV